MNQTYITLNNGLKIPQFGMGVYMVPEGEETENAVSSALKMGGRDIIGTNQRKPSKIKGLQMI